MLTRDDCIAFSGLTEEELEAIAEHEHIPLIIATELGSYLTRSDEGIPCIKRMMLDDIAHHLARGEIERAQHLSVVLNQFDRNHPATRTSPPQASTRAEELLA